MLSGYKTYIVCGLAIINAAGNYLTGDTSAADAAQAVFTALMGMTIRHGIAAK